MTLTSREWLTSAEAAGRLKVHVKTVVRYYRLGDLPGRKLGPARNGRLRFPIEAVDAFLLGDQAMLAKIRRELEAAQSRQRVRPAAGAR